MPRTVTCLIRDPGADSGCRVRAINISNANKASAKYTAGQAKNSKIYTPMLGATIGITAMAADNADITWAARLPS